MQPRPSPRQGFALLTVMLVLAGAATVVLGTALESDQSIRAAQNRIERERAQWTARGCLARLLHDVDGILQRGTDEHIANAWRTLSREVHESEPDLSPCVVRLSPRGARVALNGVSEDRLVILIAAVGHGAARHDLAQSLLDWVDADSDARRHGAERAWYAAVGRIPPRNGALQDMRELRLVRGFESSPGRLFEALDVGSDRISLDHAPAEVLATLPGFTPEVVQRVLDRQRSSQPIDDLRDLLDMVSASASDGLLERFVELDRLATTGTSGWDVAITATGRAGSAPTATLRATLARTVRRATVTSMRLE